MTEPVPSRTAGRVARRRAAHQVLDRPLVFDDPLALRIAGIVESDILADIPREQHPLARALRAFLVARSRFTEDLIARAIGRGITQVVILGAGLDTFAGLSKLSLPRRVRSCIGSGRFLGLWIRPIACGGRR